MKHTDSAIHRGTGNVFEDLGLPNADQRLAKAQLAAEIRDIIRARKLTETRAAAIMGVDQPKVSALMCGRLKQFSLERLMRFLIALGRDIEIRVQPHSRRGGAGPSIRVATAA